MTEASRLDFGFLTLATPSDYPKAIALALSLRKSNPGIPIAVACSPKLRQILCRIFDYVIDEEPGIRGFAHKVYLDRYSPFKTTLFFDSDVLVFHPVADFIAEWPATPYIACGSYAVDGFSSFGLDRSAVLERIGKQKLVIIDGAGHALFSKPGSEELFDRAREITANYKEFAGCAVYADEDVMDIVMTESNLPPADGRHFFSRFLTGRPGTVVLDPVNANCTLVDAVTGERWSPCMMHFAANEAPIHYGLAMWRLFGHFGYPRAGLLKLVLADIWQYHFHRQLRKYYLLVTVWRWIRGQWRRKSRSARVEQGSKLE